MTASNLPEPPHRCHHPHCRVAVRPSLFACRSHWHALPKSLRDRIWTTYRPGQEITKDPSRAYLAAAADALDWWLN